METRISSLLFVGAGLISLIGSVAAPRLLAQTAPQSTQDVSPDEAKTGTSAKPDQVLENSRGGRSFENIPTPIGFSVGVFHSYTPDALISDRGRESAQFTSLQPRFIARIQNRKSELELQYSFGYRAYRQHSELNSSEHSASVSFDRRISRSASLQIADSFRSAFNDDVFSVTSLSRDGLATVPAGPSQELLLNWQRVTRNTLSASVSINVWKRGRIQIFGNHDYWRYGNAAIRGAQGVQVGIGGNYKINKWLSFDSGYSTYVNRIDERLKGNNIQRLQVGGLRFNTRGNVELFSSAGIDYTRSEVNRITAAVEVGISKTSNSTTISAIYHRGFTSVSSEGTVLAGNSGRLFVTQKLSRRMRYQMGVSSLRGASFVRDAGLTTLSAEAGLSIALKSHMLFSVNSSYISQRPNGLLINSRIIDRYSVSLGLQYFLNSMIGR